jgi:hypothetical protein
VLEGFQDGWPRHAGFTGIEVTGLGDAGLVVAPVVAQCAVPLLVGSELASISPEDGRET